MSDPFDLARFVTAWAGDTGFPGYDQALAEIRRGAKTSHWMWYIFPQMAGLSQSSMGRRYAIRSLAEARAFLAHPLLGPRLREIVTALMALPADRTAIGVFGSIDAHKLCSCLTLFAEAGGGPLFTGALTRWSDGPDQSTLTLLAAGAS